MTVSSSELSEREREILRLVATGASNKEIARQLYITPNTVKVHLRNIFAKIGVNSRTEAAMYAVNIGLLSETIPKLGSSSTTNVETGEAVSVEIQPTEERASRLSIKRPWWIGVVILLTVSVVLIGFLYWRARLQSSLMPAPANPLRWQTWMDMPTARSSLVSSAFENSIYAIAGMTEQGVTGVVEKLDLSSNSWVRLTDKPTPVYEASGMVIGGKLYIPGGRLDSGAVTDKLEIYDLFQARWVEGKPIPRPVCAYALAAFEGKLYLFGGWDGEKYSATVFEYDPVEDAWKNKTPLPSPRAYAGAAQAGRKIYIVGGFDGDRPLRNNDIYQPDLDIEGNNPWSSAKPLPVGRYRMGVTSIADILLVLGGLEDKDRTPVSLEYFPLTNEWQAFEQLSSDTWTDFGMVPIGTNLFIFGGNFNSSPTRQVLSYQAIYTLAIPVISR